MLLSTSIFDNTGNTISTRQSLVFSFLDRYSSLAVGVITSMVIARLLTPAEIGVYSIVMVLLVFASTVRDFGAGQYLVQKKDLTTDDIRAVWTVQLGLGLALAVLILLCSYPVSKFYGDERMLYIMFVIALNYVLNPFGSLTYAWLMREMRFDRVAIMRFCATLSGAVVAIGLALKGFGPISLAYGSLASTAVNALIAMFFRPAVFPWIPGFSGVKRVLGFGSGLTLSSIISSLATGAPELLLGKMQSLAVAGLYSRANGLVSMFYRLFSDSVGAVCLPWFSKHRREEVSLTEPFLKATAYVTALGWAFCLSVVCLAKPIVRILYGDQWDESVDLTRLLALGVMFGVPASLCPTALLSCGRVAEITRIKVVVALVTLLFVAIGSPYGMHSVGLGLLAAGAFASMYWLTTIVRILSLPVQKLIRVLWLSAIVSMGATVGPFLALILYGPYPTQFVPPLILGGVLGIIGFVVTIHLTGHPLKEELTRLKAKFFGGKH